MGIEINFPISLTILKKVNFDPSTMDRKELEFLGTKCRLKSCNHAERRLEDSIKEACRAAAYNWINSFLGKGNLLVHSPPETEFTEVLANENATKAFSVVTTTFLEIMHLMRFTTKNNYFEYHIYNAALPCKVTLFSNETVSSNSHTILNIFEMEIKIFAIKFIYDYYY